MSSTALEHHSVRVSALRSKITTKSQTTLPSGVRKALGVNAGDVLEYIIEGDHAVIRKATEGDAEDPVLGAFLELLAADMTKQPSRVRGMSSALLARIRSVVAGAPVDHGEPIIGPVAL